MITNEFIIFFFWSNGSCAITPPPCSQSCVFQFLCVFGFGFPSADDPAVATS